MTVIGTCHDEIENYFDDPEKYDIIIKEYTRECKKCISYNCFCEKCIEWAEKEDIVLHNQEEVDAWLGYHMPVERFNKP